MGYGAAACGWNGYGSVTLGTDAATLLVSGLNVASQVEHLWRLVS